MGNGLSVSSIVDRLHALQPDERSEAFDDLYEQETAFDYEYTELGRYILGSALADIDETVSKLREQVKAGRKYSVLTAKFGDGILLTLPSSIGRSTLERKLLHDQSNFDTFIQPVVGSVWEE
ncbi:hypothetical protein V8E51_017592 [Hyaloscypha variabilis]